MAPYFKAKGRWSLSESPAKCPNNDDTTLTIPMETSASRGDLSVSSMQYYPVNGLPDVLAWLLFICHLSLRLLLKTEEPAICSLF